VLLASLVPRPPPAPPLPELEHPSRTWSAIFRESLDTEKNHCRSHAFFYPLGLRCTMKIQPEKRGNDVARIGRASWFMGDLHPISVEGEALAKGDVAIL